MGRCRRLTLKNTDNCKVTVLTIQINDGDTDVIEETGFGKYSLLGEKKHIMYKSTEGGTVMINISGDEIKIKRSGDISTTMTYRCGEKTFFKYSLSYGTLIMGIETDLIENTLEENGRLHMVYKLYSAEEQMCINDTVIEIKKQ